MSSSTTLRQFWAQLSPEGRWLLSTVAVQTLGRGLTLPFTVIYLHEVRGFSLDLAGTLMAFIAVVALLVTGPGGALTDRVGARRVLLFATTSQLVGCAILAFATTPAVAALAMAFLGINFGMSWPAFNALIAAVTTGEMRQQYFGINFALVNLGIGVGGVVGGMYADVSRPHTFTVIFLADAASMLVPIALLLGPLRRVTAVHETPDDADASSGSYLAILRNPAVIGMTALTFTAVFLGYGQLETGLPAFARQAEVSTRVVGFAFAVNTAVIVLLQFLVLRLIAGHRRTRVMLVMCALWALSYVVLGATGLVPGAVAAAGVLAYMGAFALGETMMQPTIPAITNDLAPDHLRGRYNAVNAGAFQGGAITGPLFAGFVLDRGWSIAYVTVLVAGCGLIAVLALVVERLIPASVNGVPDDATLTADPATGDRAPQGQPGQG
ncbi:MFS family permease [Nocardioides sp. BE266]|uniref:MFS transporter n=1 Tax=Nocardioides sp. BE266 TaxID=2817725 RepID=UPI002865B602|nr:MFS transporter [Nocardioides sp. BE266]MDR7253413.1 MFS family permease [Nocardioides sp. BE266]